MKRRCQSRIGAFSISELIVVVVVIALLAFVLLPSIAKAKKAQQINCVNNLKQVGLAFRLGVGSGDKFAMAGSTNQGGSLEVSNEVWRTFLVLSNELGTPKLLACPSDGRPPATAWPALANSNISYFICLDADETMPEMLLSGDRNLTNTNPLDNRVLTVTTNDVFGWTGALHGDRGDITLADGSVMQYTIERMHGCVTNAIGNTPATLRLAMPE